MTETDWWAATDPDPLLDWLFFDALASERKLQLFCVACCRTERLIIDGYFIDLLGVAEEHADGQVGDEDLVARVHAAGKRIVDASWMDDYQHTNTACLYAADVRGTLGRRSRERADYESEHEALRRTPFPLVVVERLRNAITEGAMEAQREQSLQNESDSHVHFLHDLFGPLPFRDITIAPAWRTSDVMALTKGIYDEKAFDRMPILADALQEAGCDNEEVLNHCRAERWEHVRGCWVIDLILGKPWRESQ